MELIGVCYNENGSVYYFSPKGMKFSKDDHVIIRSSRGKKIARVVVANQNMPSNVRPHKIGLVIARATSSDLREKQKLNLEAKQVIRVAKDQVRKNGLDMKIINAEYLLDRSKLIISFISDNRIDFRNLVRNLANRYRTRVELRQVGVRDEAKKLGGIGPCGRPLCCTTFLGSFMPVSIKMAKEQGISLNPIKISGICARLMCCLKYEDETYKEALQTLPHRGAEVSTASGVGHIEAINYLTKIVKVRLQEKGTFADFFVDEIKVIKTDNLKS